MDAQATQTQEVADYETALDTAGGVASAFFWGIVGDVFGRRKILSLTLLLDAMIMLAQSTVNDYRLLLAARSMNGFLIAIAWLVIPFKTVDFHTVLPVASWRLYLALGSLPGFVSGLWMLTLPESPRLLADTNRGDKALKLLTNIHRKNNGKGAEFKIKKIIQNDIFIDKLLGTDESRSKVLFLGVLKDLKVFVSKSYAVKSSIILFVFFANMAAGFGLNLWIPELLLRMQGKDCKFGRQIALPENARLVNDSAWQEYTKMFPQEGRFNDSNFDTYESANGEEKCDDFMDDDVFTSGLIVGACCVLGNAACALLCAHGGGRGVRRAAAACALACALACACLAACACSCASSNKVIYS
ncbi:unnamed protein product [Diatraea saccharalis]|uniref:Uncharacterized protein n=1 Tax=Diatraea saccharalis TaxID=40085 RepID=A0A9N9WAW8_9NEOP|nr:unnamed protein product [Diatraea saccharalis]